MSSKLRLTLAAAALGVALAATPAQALPAPKLVKVVKTESAFSGLWSRLVSIFAPAQVTIDPNGAASDGGVFIDPNGARRDTSVTIDPNGGRRDTNVTIDPNGGGR